MKGEIEAAAPKDFADPARAAVRSLSVVTKMSFSASPARVWKDLVFYEEVGTRPPLHLRLLLPVPIRTEGQISGVGSEATCLYEGGHLVKRVTRIEPERTYQFEVAEQKLSVGGGMKLLSGQYTLQGHPDGTTEVAVATRYSSNKWPRWFWRFVESVVCHSFHRFILRAMRRRIES